MELKLTSCSTSHNVAARSNCTFMELKLITTELFKVTGISSNCTFMELKLHQGSTTLDSSRF